MQPPRKPRRIKNLTDPRGLQKLVMHGLRLTEGTTVCTALEETGFEKKSLFLRFAKADGTERNILFEDDIDLAGLPFRTVSLRTLAGAIKDPMHGFNLHDLGALVFCAAIDRYAKVHIVLGADMMARKALIRLSVTIRKFSSRAVCTPTELAGFVEAFDDRDHERGGEEQ